jgi:hypothetical protein
MEIPLAAKFQDQINTFTIIRCWLAPVFRFQAVYCELVRHIFTDNFKDWSRPEAFRYFFADEVDDGSVNFLDLESAADTMVWDEIISHRKMPDICWPRHSGDSDDDDASSRGRKRTNVSAKEIMRLNMRTAVWG